MQLTMYCCILALSWMGARMIVGSALTTGELMSLFTYTMNILMSLMMLSMIFVMLSMSMACLLYTSSLTNRSTTIGSNGCRRFATGKWN